MSTAASLEAQTRSWPRRHRRELLVGVILFVAIALAVGAALSWHFSSAVVVPNRSSLAPDATVQAVSGERIVLSRSADTLRPGVYGLEWHGGHAIVEGVIASTSHSVTRRLNPASARPPVAASVAVDNSVYVGNPRQALGLPFTEVRVPDELGPMPAWLIPGRTHTWTIVVHGINSDRDDVMRIAPALHAAGSSTLLITYREDVGAPPSPDGLHHMGLTEWRDLQAAVGYALAHGAQRIVLAGYSMGGAIVSQFMERSPLAHSVSGLILDAPALDWKSVLAFNAKEMGLPSFAALPVEWMVGARIDADWNSLDALRHTAYFHLPILLFHGSEDKLVPISISNAFASALPGWVTYYRVPHAAHVESWNVDPSSYDQRVGRFLARLGVK
ncbi:MAG TPA: alpha/beta hydrolase [Solirubrobacteraceae bacterium]|nr:alpha/beta hydrolase [Solirubrobacteraceae bacterium]